MSVNSICQIQIFLTNLIMHQFYVTLFQTLRGAVQQLHYSFTPHSAWWCYSRSRPSCRCAPHGPSGRRRNLQSHSYEAVWVKYPAQGRATCGQSEPRFEPPTLCSLDDPLQIRHGLSPLTRVPLLRRRHAGGQLCFKSMMFSFAPIRTCDADNQTSTRFGLSSS